MVRRQFRLWKHDVYFLLLGNKYYPIPYDLKENRLSLAIHTFFSRILLWFQRELCRIGLLIVFLYFIYHNEK
jgi:hypothetical protein